MSTYKRENKEFKARIDARVELLRAKRFQKTAVKIATMTIDENGDVLFLATDSNDIFLELGTVVTKRASHVEPATFWARRAFHLLRSVVSDKSRSAEWTRLWTCRWRVNTKPVGGPILTWRDVYTREQVASMARIGSIPVLLGLRDIATWQDRQDAIDAEVKFLNEFFLNGRTV